LFFFSSRRRHTRSYGDWSSDVCSSDLLLSDRAVHRVIGLRQETARVHHPEAAPLPLRVAEVTVAGSTGPLAHDGRPAADDAVERSEERRVGKEWRAGGGWSDEQNRRLE